MTEKEKVLQKLKELDIPYEILEHPLVHTIEEMEILGICDHGTVCKNLFLRDQNGKRHFLAILDKDRQIGIQEIRRDIGSTRLSFGSSERLQKCMQLQSGAVGPFGLLNDPEHKVEVIVDQTLKDKDKIGFHPNDNTATLWISYQDFIKYLHSTGHTIFLLK